MLIDNWSQKGIDQLKIRINNHHLDNRKAMLLISSDLYIENKRGLDAFINFLEQLGFDTIKKIPKKLSMC